MKSILLIYIATLISSCNFGYSSGNNGESAIIIITSQPLQQSESTKK